MSVHSINPTTIRLTTADLSTGHRLILWAMRRWVRNVRLGRITEHEIRQGFACFGVGSAARSLDQAMMCIGTGALRAIEIRCDGAVGVSADEYRLLRAIQAAATGQADLCAAILYGMTAAAASRISSQHCSKLATDLIAGLGELDALPLPRPRTEKTGAENTDPAKIVQLFGKHKHSAA